MSDLRAAFQGMRGQMPPAPAVQPPAVADGGLVPFGSVKVDAGIVDQAAELASQFPSLKPVSGHRDAQTNKREKGVDRSWHLKGRAVDFKGPVKDLYEAAAAAQAAGAAEALVHNAGNGMILHVAWA